MHGINYSQINNNGGLRKRGEKLNRPGIANLQTRLMIDASRVLAIF